MKRILMVFMVTALAAFTFSCDDIEQTPQFKESDADVTVSPSTSSVAVTATDSLNAVLSLNWSDPQYVVGLEKSKFTVRVAKGGSNFSSFASKEFTGVLTGDLLGKELNGMAFKFGGVAGEPIMLDVMVVASHLNNNEPKNSNVVQITVTPFADLGISASPASVVLASATAAETATTLTWTTAFNGFGAVKTYELQYAKGGTDFADAVSETVTSFTKSYTHEELNDLALGYGTAPDTEGTIEFRIRATNELGTELFSNTATVTVTPYATSFPPLYAMGNALKGWGPWPDNAVELVSTEFKKYETFAYFTNGNAFRFFEQLDWGPDSYNYPFFATVDPLFENANDGDSNFKFVGATGWYEVNVDLIAKTVTAVETDEPVLYMTGAALNGWNWDNPIKMTYIKPGVFQATTDFSNETFRFFAQADWGPVSYNYPYFESVDLDFENANDGDSNLRYIGTPGSRKITVNLIDKTVILGDPTTSLYMTGAALNGWNWDNPVEMTMITPGIFEATATFTSGEAFRFFAQADWGPTSFNYPHFVTVDADFENASDGDSNLKFVGTTGTYKITVNLITKVVSLQ